MKPNFKDLAIKWYQDDQGDVNSLANLLEDMWADGYEVGYQKAY